MTQPSAPERHGLLMSKCVTAVVTAVVGVGLASCSSDPDSGTSAAFPTQPEVCAAADDLRVSLTALQDVRVDQEGASAALENAWARARQAWAQFVDAAGDEHGDQVEAVQAEARAAAGAVDAAQDTASADSLTTAATAVESFFQEADALVEEASSTC
jgi:peptidoglycan hydrolase CwlO-like protein